MRRAPKLRTISRKPRGNDRRSNLDGSLFESEYMRSRYDDVRPALKNKKSSLKQSARRKRSAAAYAFILSKTVFTEKYAYKIQFKSEVPEDAEDDSAYTDFLKMIGAFEARSRLLKSGPFSSSSKPKSSKNPNRDFPELNSLLENLPRHRVPNLSPEPSVNDQGAFATCQSDLVCDAFPNTDPQSRSQLPLDIEEYPAFDISQCDDIADLTAAIDSLTFPKSMSSMAAAMYS